MERDTAVPSHFLAHFALTWLLISAELLFCCHRQSWNNWRCLSNTGTVFIELSSCSVEIMVAFKYFGGQGLVNFWKSWILLDSLMNYDGVHYFARGLSLCTFPLALPCPTRISFFSVLWLFDHMAAVVNSATVEVVEGTIESTTRGECCSSQCAHLPDVEHIAQPKS